MEWCLVLYSLLNRFWKRARVCATYNQVCSQSTQQRRFSFVKLVWVGNRATASYLDHKNLPKRYILVLFSRCLSYSAFFCVWLIEYNGCKTDIQRLTSQDMRKRPNSLIRTSYSSLARRPWREMDRWRQQLDADCSIYSKTWRFTSLSTLSTFELNKEIK